MDDRPPLRGGGGSGGDASSMLGDAANPAALEDGARLWQSLAAPNTRKAPAKGFDRFGERVAGWFAHRKVRRLDWTRAKAIIGSARSMATFSQAAFDDQITTARTLAVTQRDNPDTIDLGFAVAYEAIRREIGLSLHDEQVLGAIALATGCCAELATGEGKTLTAILPAAIDGWTGRGVHVITVNDYLARRDAQTTSAAYRRLGISVGVVQESTSHEGRVKAYAADITYTSDKQVIFDHLRDRLVTPVTPRMSGLILDGLLTNASGWPSKVVQRGLHAAIVDEADSVLIDEAVTPAIISLPGDGGQITAGLQAACQIARSWTQGREYTADAKLRVVKVTDAGRAALEGVSSRLPAFWAGPRRREELLVQAITAKELYRLGEDYVISDGKIMIVDRSTGRILPGRQWQLGLHQAVEVKEGLDPTAPTHVASRSSYQGFYQRYRRLSGMSGTATEVAPELWAWYRLPVVRVPTHRPVQRTVVADRIFATTQQKLEAAAARVRELNRQGRPVLLGAWSVNTSEQVSELLTRAGVDHRVLNATREAEEAAIIERAGEDGAVTVATNMAGRGTDIRLSAKARVAGGLMVVATERHDEARVDRQLAGRAGRQGDPGGVEVFVSLEDKLVLQNGLTPLLWLAKHTTGAIQRLICRVLWWQAQQSASNKWTTIRAQVAQADAWLDMAMHNVSR
jgi:preprotein translocase subunit SecA